MSNKFSNHPSKKDYNGQNAATSQVKLREQNFVTQQELNDEKTKTYVDVKYQQNENLSACGFFADFMGLYRYGSTKEKALMFLGIALGLMSGVAYPLHIYFWGKEIDHMIFDGIGIKSTLDLSLHYFLAFIGISIGSLLLNGLSFSIWRLISQTIGRKIREKYLYAFSKRKMDWIQQANLYEVSSSFKQDAFAIQKAIGDKIALLFNLIGLLISGCIAAVAVRWTFFLYIFALLPIGMAVLGYFIYVIVMKKIDSKKFYQKAQSRSVEAVSLIKTVKSMGAQKFQQNLYQNSLNEYKDKISIYPIKLAVSTGLFYFIQYFMFGVGYLLGIQCIRGTSACPVSVTGSNYTVGEMHTIFLQIFICAYNFLQLAANYEAVQDAIKSSKKIYSFIEQTQVENQREKEQQKKDIKLPQSIGQILIEKVSFAYPTNPEKKILKDVSIKPLKNKFNAIVGTTGSGKSTVTQLIMKFYPPSSGTIQIGGVNIKDLDEEWLRERMGIVGQQPILFDGTIRENVRVGKKDATDDQIWEVLKKTNLSEFVRRLPNQLDYNLGLGGSKLSGGQKQRFAIARALIKKPQLLILDQATSALDRKSQKMIQKTLQSIFLSPDLSMTVICIAHKIRTIQKADRIWYLQNGYVKESGKFNELKCFQGVQLPPEDQQIQFDQQIALPIKSEDKKHEMVVSQVQDADYDKNIYAKLLQYTQQKGYYALSIFFSVLCGLCHPFAILMVSYIYADQASTSYWGTNTQWCKYPMSNGGNCEQLIQDNHNNSLKFVGGLFGLSVFCFFPYFLQIFFTSKIQDEVTLKLSMEVYKKMIRMPVGWYQKPQNEGGQAASNYGLDVKQMSTLITTYIPVLVMNFTTIISGIIICFIYFWKEGLISLACLPLIAFGSYVGMIFISGYEDESLHLYDSSNKTAMQLMINIKTALSFNHHTNLLKKYHDLLYQPSSVILCRGLKIGIFYGLSSMMVLGTIGIILYSTAHLLASGNIEFSIDFLASYSVQIWSGWVAGNSFFFASKSAAGKNSAKRVFKLLQTQNESEYQSQKSKQNIKVPIDQIKGNISLKNVSFKYKNTDKYIIKDINLTILAGQKIAFVGQSGCGKSTLMLLIQRFYDYEGEITLDGINILNYDLQTYRSYFAVLNQQPNLFSGNLKDNIIANSGASASELEQACKSAFAYDMNRAWKGDISLSDNIKIFLDRQVGPKGSKVSGGQKQRIACARAILKKPKIFLMDQGTSALDLETEKRMQKNIDDRFDGVTAINIAHRLEAIENSDVIYLFEGGRIVESGRYKQMLDNKGPFYKFVQGSKFRSIDQVAELMLNKLVQKLLGIKK